MGNTLISETRVTTPVFRLAFPHVFEKSQVNGKGAFKFRIAMLFDKELHNTELVPLRNLIKDLIKQKWGADFVIPMNSKGEVDDKLFFYPIKDGDKSVSLKTGEPYDGFAGTKVANAASEFERPVVDGGDAAKGIKPQEILKANASEIYGGCYCKASVNVYAWENMGTKGVSIGFLALQKVKDGKQFSAFANAAEDFEPITAELVDVDKDALFDDGLKSPAEHVGGDSAKPKNDLMSQL